MGPGSNPTRALKNIDDSSRIRNRSPLVAFPRRQHDHHFASSTGSRRPSQSFLTHLAKVPPMDPLFLVSQRSVPRILDILLICVSTNFLDIVRSRPYRDFRPTIIVKYGSVLLRRILWMNVRGSPKSKKSKWNRVGNSSAGTAGTLAKFGLSFWLRLYG